MKIKNVTWSSLRKIIEDEPTLIVKSTKEEVVAITCDETGIVCEDDYGAVVYNYNEVLYE